MLQGRARGTKARDTQQQQQKKHCAPLRGSLRAHHLSARALAQCNDNVPGAFSLLAPWFWLALNWLASNSPFQAPRQRFRSSPLARWWGGVAFTLHVKVIK